MIYAVKKRYQYVSKYSKTKLYLPDNLNLRDHRKEVYPGAVTASAAQDVYTPVAV